MMAVNRLIVLAAVDLGIPALAASCSVKSFFVEARFTVGCNHENSKGGELSLLDISSYMTMNWYVV